MNQTKVLVYGAGSIGCYIGGALLNAGINCTLLARKTTKQNLECWGLRLTDYQQREIHLNWPINILTDTDDLPKADIVLLTVKCKDVEAAAKDLQGKIGDDTLVVCLQNGVGAKEIAARYLPQDRLLSGVVSFNVLNMGEGRFHRGNKGELVLESHPKLDLDLFNQDGMPARFSLDIESVLWGKLILNLNNSINALSGIPLLEELSQQGYRKILAASIIELLGLLKQKKIKPEALSDLPPAISAYVLRLPNWLFLRIAKKVLQIDPLARSSMWEDFEKKRKTEIDYLNGAVVNLANQLGQKAPVSSRLIELVKKAENASKSSPMISAQQLTELMS